VDNKRRVRLFTIGVVFGTIVMYFAVFKNRNIYKSPQEVVLGRMTDNPMKTTDKAECKLKCFNLDGPDLKLYFQKADVSFSDSKTHQKPWPIYTVNSEPYTFYCEVGEDKNRLIDIVLMNGKDTCDCK
jgi:hypothetical protein